MQYVAVMLCPDGGVIRHAQTREVATILIGDFDSMDEAINQACIELNCLHLHKGVLTKGEGLGGFMIVTAQELVAV
jgi:hypothetical protein